ncbi:MAG: phage tail tape measure protein [Kouleothrix sp.]|nr:phage tail tape measure protein [Kouleothrix sp.]
MSCDERQTASTYHPAQGRSQRCPWQASRHPQQCWRLLSGAFTAGVVGAGIAIAGLAAGSLTAAADFETATANFASVAGGSLAEAGFALDDVKSKALELGAVTQFSAGQAQDAMIALAKAGCRLSTLWAMPPPPRSIWRPLARSSWAGCGHRGQTTGVWANTGVNAAQVANLMAQAAKRIHD